MSDGVKSPRSAARHADKAAEHKQQKKKKHHHHQASVGVLDADQQAAIGDEKSVSFAPSSLSSSSSSSSASSSSAASLSSSVDASSSSSSDEERGGDTSNALVRLKAMQGAKIVNPLSSGAEKTATGTSKNAANEASLQAASDTANTREGHKRSKTQESIVPPIAALVNASSSSSLNNVASPASRHRGVSDAAETDLGKDVAKRGLQRIFGIKTNKKK